MYYIVVTYKFFPRAREPYGSALDFARARASDRVLNSPISRASFQTINEVRLYTLLWNVSISQTQPALLRANKPILLRANKPVLLRTNHAWYSFTNEQVHSWSAKMWLRIELLLLLLQPLRWGGRVWRTKLISNYRLAMTLSLKWTREI